MAVNTDRNEHDKVKVHTESERLLSSTYVWRASEPTDDIISGCINEDVSRRTTIIYGNPWFKLSQTALKSRAGYGCVVRLLTALYGHKP